ncbi:MAG: mechanosensitive ion channel family protein [Acidithiobacillales bacterium]
MSNPAGPLSRIVEQVAGYLPSLFAAALVLLLGVAAGWVVRQGVIRALVWLRLDRLGARAGWRAAFEKGDVRAALYKVAGNVAMLLVVLVFLDNVLQILGLTVLSRAIDRLVLTLPNLALVALIVAVGSALASGVAHRVEDALDDEDFPRARFVGRLVRGALLSVVGAIALWQLDLARQVVLAAFVIFFGSFAVASALALGLGSARAVERGWDRLVAGNDEPKRGEKPEKVEKRDRTESGKGGRAPPSDPRGRDG